MLAAETRKREDVQEATRQMMVALERENWWRPEYCRRQAARMRALAKQCSDPNIRDQVETMAKSWADKAAAREDRPALHEFILA